MTKVQIRYILNRPADDAVLRTIAEAPRLFGLTRIQLSPDSGSIVVEYDASRLTPAQVDAALHSAGVPAGR